MESGKTITKSEPKKQRVGGISDGSFDRSLRHDLRSLPEKGS